MTAHSNDKSVTTLAVARKMARVDVPVIDLEGDQQGEIRAQTVKQLTHACQKTGFFYICNHQVPANVIDDLRNAATDFFCQDAGVKEAYLLNQRMRGYLPLYYKSYAGEKNAGTSHQEGFWIGDDRPINSSRPLDGPNLWPKTPGRLKPAMLAYQQSMKSVASLLMRCFALALNLKDSAFESLFHRPSSRLKLNHYPPQLNPENENNIGVIPHTDSGGFTILWQDDNGGLEIKSKSGEWLGVPPIEDTLIVNLGNMMPVWSRRQVCVNPSSGN